MPAEPGTWMLLSWSQRTRCAALLAWLGLCAGCAGRGNLDLLESQLREQESLLRHARSEVTELQSQLAIARREQELLQAQLTSEMPRAGIETVQAFAAAQGIKFHSLLTAMQDVDGQPGDDQLHVLLFPHDADGDLVKLSGELEVELFDPGHEGGMERIGRWRYSNAESQELWYNGFLSSGFQLDLPLSTLPRGNKLVVHGRLKTPDGRQFDASHTVSTAGSGPQSGTSPEYLAPPRATLSERAQPKPADASREIQPASFTFSDDATIDRPVPDPFSGPVSISSSPDHSGDATANKPRALPSRAGEPAPVRELSGPSPFPSGLQTSDRWTDDTLPVVR
ncbi:MAG: hypothetical protein KDA58_04270 [Planctomycetaceae bacterium]|nr:hypothetical protein [Planctomycetaceae bacterium]